MLNVNIYFITQSHYSRFLIQSSIWKLSFFSFFLSFYHLYGYYLSFRDPGYHSIIYLETMLLFVIMPIMPSSIWKLSFFSWFCLSWFTCFIFFIIYQNNCKRNRSPISISVICDMNFYPSIIHRFWREIEQFRENRCITYYQSPWTLNESSILPAFEYNPKI